MRRASPHAHCYHPVLDAGMRAHDASQTQLQEVGSEHVRTVAGVSASADLRGLTRPSECDSVCKWR